MSTRIIIGDARERLTELPADSVHCVVTSPPYWGLRDYGTARWDGGDESCEHAVGGQVQDTKAPGAITTGQRPGVDASRCRVCGARRIDSQIGLESDYREYVAALVGVFREVRRVLRADGTVWLNLGDSYAGRNLPGWRDGNEVKNGGASNKNGVGYVAGLKPKDVVGIPWRVAFALQDDGWYLRQDIIWSKPNPMPESVTDRCTKAHEYIFLLSKNARYWFDAEAIAEPSQYAGDQAGICRGTKRRAFAMGREPSGNEIPGANWIQPETRNKRSVWEVTTAPYSEAHFATFPPALIEPCILAGCPVGGTVLDPFFGAGTTGLVADRLGRNCIGIELNPQYVEMARTRIEDDAGLFYEAAQ